MLRISGENFDVDSFLHDCKIIPVAVGRKGERRFPNSTKNKSVHMTSGANFEISSADFSDLNAQISDVINFFKTNYDWIIHTTSFTFPPELLNVLNAANIYLEISIYPCEDEAPE